MLYDTASGSPRPGSLLESVFILMAKRRQEAEYFKTKALILANIAMNSESAGKMLDEALDSYRNAIFPFLAEEKKKQDGDSKKLLKSWTSKMLKVRPLWRAQEHKGVVSRLRKGAEKVKQAESLRRSRPHRRI
jgi:hypothetical protein